LNPRHLDLKTISAGPRAGHAKTMPAMALGSPMYLPSITHITLGLLLPAWPGLILRQSRQAWVRRSEPWQDSARACLTRISASPEGDLRLQGTPGSPA